MGHDGEVTTGGLTFYGLVVRYVPGGSVCKPCSVLTFRRCLSEGVPQLVRYAFCRYSGPDSLQVQPAASLPFPVPSSGVAPDASKHRALRKRGMCLVPL